MRKEERWFLENGIREAFLHFKMQCNFTAPHCSDQRNLDENEVGGDGRVRRIFKRGAGLEQQCADHGHQKQRDRRAARSAGPSIYQQRKVNMRQKHFQISVLVSCMFASSAMVHAADEKAAHWGYAGNSGPSHWSELGAHFASCKLGKQQSPVDIRPGEKPRLAPIAFRYAPTAGEIVNNGHSVQVNLNEAGTIGLPSGDYKLMQFHFHTPSEEAINGKRYPLVAHFVHQNEEGGLAVIAVLFKVGKENASLKQVFDALPATEGDKRALAAPINLTSALPQQRGYYAYMGSLTTPPCSEGVHWQVLRQPSEISKQQLTAFQKLYPMNARPVQPLNGRVIDVGN